MYPIDIKNIAVSQSSSVRIIQILLGMLKGSSEGGTPIPISSQVDRAPATTMVDSRASIPGQVKLETIKFGGYCFPAKRKTVTFLFSFDVTITFKIANRNK